MGASNYYLLTSGGWITPGYTLYIDPSNIESFNATKSNNTVLDLVDKNNFIFYPNGVNYSNNYVIFRSNNHDYARLNINPPILDLSSCDFTIEILFWNATGNLVSNPIIFKGDPLQPRSLDWGISIINNYLAFQNKSGILTLNGFSFEANVVYHICLVYNSAISEFGCYINNVYYMIYNNAGTPITSNFYAVKPNGTLGAVSLLNPILKKTFGGGIGTIRLYDKSLSANEVLNNYNIEILKKI